MKRDKFKLDEEQQKIFNQYKYIVPSTLYKKFYGFPKRFGETELLNAGYLGLAYAIKNFQEGKNCKFKTYAIYVVRYFIIRCIKSMEFKINKPMQYISTNEMEQVEETGLPCKGCNFTLVYDLSAIEERADSEINIEIIKKAAKKVLSDRYYYIFNSLYSDGKTAKQIALELGITTSRVYDINRRIIYRLKTNLEARGML